MDGTKSSGHHSGGRWEIVEKIEGASRDKLLDRINPDASGIYSFVNFHQKKLAFAAAILYWYDCHTHKSNQPA